MEVYNGKYIFFWYDFWLCLGRFKDVVGDRGFFGIGIVENVLVEEVLRNYRRIRYRIRILNELEDEIDKLRDRDD